MYHEIREETWPIDRLKPHEQNYNGHPDDQVDRIAASLREYGQPKRIVIRGDGTILAGHGVWQGALRNEWATVKVAIVPDEWSDARAIGFLVADNETRRGADPDLEVLADLIDLAQMEVSLEALGFTSESLDALLAELQAENTPEAGAGGDEFDATPDDGPTRAQLGDLWIIGGVHRLLVGDCTDPANVARLMQGERADMVFSDPPYNVSYQDNESIESLKARNRRTDGKIVSNDSMTDEQFDVFLDRVLAALPLAPGGVYYLCAPAGRTETQFRNALDRAGDIPLRQCIVWLKDRFVFGRQDYHWRHESILYGWKDGAAHYFIDDRTQDTVWEIARPSASPDHPTQKPVELPERALRNSSVSGGVVFDGFLGSGTTLIAAHRTGRRCYGCELSPKYADVILRRAEAEGLSVKRVRNPNDGSGWSESGDE